MSSSAVAEGRPAAAGGAGEGSKAKGRAEGGANRTARKGRAGGGGGGRGRRGRGKKGGQSGWRKKGDFAKKEDLLHEMKWPKTRRKVSSTATKRAPGGGGVLLLPVYL